MRWVLIGYLPVINMNFLKMAIGLYVNGKPASIFIKPNGHNTLVFPDTLWKSGQVFFYM
jgi:hypothetical protein